MLRNVLSYCGSKYLMKTPTLWPHLSSVVSNQGTQEANDLIKRVVDRHMQTLESKDLPASYFIEDFLFDLHFNRPTEPHSEVIEALSFMIERTNGKVRITRAWLEALQNKLNLNWFPTELFRIPYRYLDNRYYAEQIHRIHKATYNILEARQVIPTLRLIYRNAVKDDEEIALKGKLSTYTVLENMEAKLEGVPNIRCCSLKPHACENYDFDFRRKSVVIIARGMDEENAMSQFVALPTVLFTRHGLNYARYKSNLEANYLIVLDTERLYTFFYLFEPEFN